MSNSRSARYHARRRTRLMDRLGAICERCSDTERARLQIAHIHGDGGQHRKARGNAGEITRLLALPLEILTEEVTLMCAPCHVENDLAAGYLNWRS